MSAGRIVAATLAAVLAVFLLACGPEGGTPDSKAQPAQRGGPNPNAQNVQPPNPDVNVPGPVQGDPSACHELHKVWMNALWKSETKATPKIEYSIGGAQIPATNVYSSRTQDGMWAGVWAWPVMAKCGDSLGFTVYGTASFVLVKCFFTEFGQEINAQTGTRNCASAFRPQ